MTERAAWGPGTLEMALPLVEAVGIRPGMRVQEVGGGSGQVAAIPVRHWDVTVVVLEPWVGGGRIQARPAGRPAGPSSAPPLGARRSRPTAEGLPAASPRRGA